MFDSLDNRITDLPSPQNQTEGIKTKKREITAKRKGKRTEVKKGKKYILDTSQGGEAEALDTLELKKQNTDGHY